VAAKTEQKSPILEVEIGEELGLMSALKWTNEMQLHDIDFEMDCKRVVKSLYSTKIYSSALATIITNCRLLLATNMVNSRVKFIRRKVNEIAHSLAQVAPSFVSFHSFSDIPTCIYSNIMNEMR
jgi:hypothetical protein